MKASKAMLSSLLVTLLLFSLMPVSVLGDGPWDIDNGTGSNETNGGGLIHDRSATSSSAGLVTPGSEEGVEGPTLVEVVTYSLLKQLGFTNLAEKIIVSDYHKSQMKESRVISKTRR